MHVFPVNPAQLSLQLRQTNRKPSEKTKKKPIVSTCIMLSIPNVSLQNSSEIHLGFYQLF
jgi:hypothetical protein